MAEKEEEKPTTEVAKSETQGSETPEAKSPAEPEKNEVAAKETKPSPAPVHELQEKNVKTAFLEKFKLSKKSNASNTAEKDASVAEGEVQSAEVMAEALYRQLNEVKKNEYLL